MERKKMRFPLEMRGGEKVHTLEGLRDAFDIGRVLVYAEDGRLTRWLRDRGAAELAETIEALDKKSEDYAKGICKAILGEAGETILKQMEAARAEKEQAEREEEKRLKIEAEKAEAERRREAEEKRKEEEQRIRRGTAVIQYDDKLYIAEGSRLVRCKTAKVCHSDFVNPGYSTQEVIHPDVILAGNEIYYKKKEGNSWRSLSCFLCKLNWETGEEKKICEISEYIVLRGVKKGKLFYGRSTSNAMEGISGEDIVELDLGSLREKVHKLQIGSRKGFGLKGKICVGESGTHMYGPIHSYAPDEAYIADIDLERDRIEKLIPLGIQYSDYDAHFAQAGQGFVVYEEPLAMFCFGGITEVKIVYYDMETKQARRLEKLEKAYYSDWFRRRLFFHKVSQICGCGEKLYFIEISSDELLITECNLTSGKCKERAHFTNKEIALKGKFTDCSLRFFIGGDYLYMKSNHGYGQLWRFSMEDWKPKLMIDGKDE